MDKKLTIAYVEKPEEAAWGKIGQGVHEYNLQEAGDLNFQRICFVLQNPEGDILGGVIQESGERGQFAQTLNPVFEALKERNYLAKVFHLDPHAIFYWAQLPPFKRAKTDLDSTEISLVDLVERLQQKKASCFVDVSFSGANMNCLLFFHEGNFTGGSYAWGSGA